tara:strand:- start:234 stop:527 length:294 start_codon:yes stop_codon:yes gene_type:complete
MSNERIDLTESELRKQIIKHEGKYSYPTSDVDMGDVETILHCINGIGLIAELKRCYYEIDLLREYAKCENCGGQYIGPMDYGLHEWNHSEDCEYASE